MAVQFHSDPYDDKVGSFGVSIGKALSGLAEQKMKQYQQRQTAKQNSEAFMAAGVPYEKAIKFGNAPMPLQELLMKQLVRSEAFSGNEQNQQQQQGNGLEQQLGQLFQRLQQMKQQQQGQPPAQYSSPQDQIAQDLGRPFNQQAQELTNLLSGVPQQQVQTQQPMQQEEQQETEPLQQEIQPKPEPLIPEKKPKTFPERFSTSRPSAADIRADKKIASQEKQFAFNFNKKYIDDTDKAARDAKTTINNLNTQMSLVNRGKLIGPRANALLDVIGHTMGLDENGISALKNSDSQVYEKLSIPYFNTLKEKFGARPTQWDAQQLQKSFPTLYQTTAGKKVIIELMKHDAVSSIKEAKLRNDIIKENYGTPPLDLSSQVNDRLDHWKDSEFIKLRSKASEALAEEYAPTISAKESGKGKMLQSEDGTVLVSNGKRWEILWSDNEE